MTTFSIPFKPRFGAMAYQRLGKTLEAIEELQLFRKQIPEQQSADSVLGRTLREAETLIEGAQRH